MRQSTLSTAFTDILVDFATYLADLAATVTLPAFRHIEMVDNKEAEGAFDPVTEADRGAEAVIRQMIEKAYPDHEIEGEEYGFKDTGSDFRWVLDPIDGTRAYISGLPSWGTLIALKYKGEPLIGIIDQPYLKERYVGTMATATLNDKPITTRKIGALDKATLSTTDADLFNLSDRACFDAVKSTTRLVRYGLDCYAYARLAAGSLDVVMETGLQPYDRMALIPVIVGAGGAALDWSGNAAGASDELLAIGDPALKDPILDLISKTR